MGACARNMYSDSAEIKPAQCCIKLVFSFDLCHDSYILGGFVNLQNVTNGFFMSLCPPVCPHVTTRFPPYGFPWNFEMICISSKKKSLHLCLHKALKIKNNPRYNIYKNSPCKSYRTDCFSIAKCNFWIGHGNILSMFIVRIIWFD